MNEYDNNSVLTAWMRLSKKGDKIVMNVDRDALSEECSIVDGKVKIICNLNKVVGLIQGDVSVVAVNHLKATTVERKTLKVKFVQ